jgi:glycosyltransferase involved in cell wall biosynthesis
MALSVHILALPHTRIHHTHCAFTQKVATLSRLLQSRGYDVSYYGIGRDGIELGASAVYEVLTPDQQTALLGHDFSDTTRLHEYDTDILNPAFVAFNHRLRSILADSVGEKDLVLYPFGRGHEAVLGSHKGVAIESGIGYNNPFLPFRIYDSYAWMHYTAGAERAAGNAYHFVIPNAYDTEAWPVGDGSGGYALYFGRLGDAKGLRELVEVARCLPNQRFVICGQGNPLPYLTLPNIEYKPPVFGAERATLLGNASVMVALSRFVEPFNMAAVESQLVGTPVVCSSFGGFVETVEHGKTGARCHTLQEMVDAVVAASTFDRQYVSQRARRLYSLAAVGPQYDAAFSQIVDLYGNGWHSPNNYRPFARG